MQTIVTHDFLFQPEDIPMNTMGSGGEMSPGYATIDSRMAAQDRTDYRPPGGVPLFPNIPPQVSNVEFYFASVLQSLVSP